MTSARSRIRHRSSSNRRRRPRDPQASGRGHPETDAPFRLLYVCYGNVCRSVMAELFTQQAIGAWPRQYARRFLVSSAGTMAVDGQFAHPYVADALAGLGIDVGSVVSRRLTPALLAETDLVLAATVRIRDRAVGLLPTASRRTFTIREFARVAGHLPAGAPGNVPRLWSPVDPVERARRVVEAVATLRGQVPLVAPTLDDINDPRLRAGAFRSCARNVSVAVHACAVALCPEPW